MDEIILGDIFLEDVKFKELFFFRFSLQLLYDVILRLNVQHLHLGYYF